MKLSRVCWGGGQGRARLLWAVWAGLFANTGAALAQAPPNDACQNAIQIQDGVPITGTTIGATTDGVASCADSSNDVYYRLIASVTDDYSFSLCFTPINWNTVLSVHLGCPATPANQIACNDDNCGLRSQIDSVRLTAGVMYIVRVGVVGGPGNANQFILVDQKGDKGACCVGTACTQVASCSAACIGIGRMCITGALCNPNPCGKGACCQPMQMICRFVTEPDCAAAAGRFQGIGGACTSSACTFGACCDPGAPACRIDTPEACTGTFTANAGCASTNCSTGACCDGATCTNTAATVCTGPNRHFAGPGTVCNAAGNLTTPCCYADFNHSGAVSVQDIFDYLFAYFGGALNADANHSGSLSVQDLFDYLFEYFSGC